MARLDYITYEDASPTLREAYDEIRTTRAEVGNIYRLLGNSPDLLKGFRSFLRVLRQEFALDLRLRELVTMAVAKSTGTRYVWAHHTPQAKAAGVTEAELAAIGKDEDVFDSRTLAALRYAAEVASGPVKDETFADLRRHFTPKEITDLTFLAGTYVLVNRWLTAMQADLEPDFQDVPWSE